MNRSSIPVKNFVILILISGYSLCFYIWSFFINLTDVKSYSDTLFPWIVIAFFIQIYCFVGIKKVSIFDIGIWFLLLSYLFMFGYLFIDFFGLESSLLWTPIKEYSQITLFQAGIFVNLCLNMFSLGYLLVYKKDPNNFVLNGQMYEVNNAKKYKLGVIICLIGGFCQVVTSLTLVAVTQSFGSYTAYSQAASSGIVDDIAFLFVPGVLYILASKKLSHYRALVFTGIVIIYFSSVMLLSGSRKTQVFGILAVALCYLYTYKPARIKLGKIILLLVGSVVFLNMIYIIREYRMNLVEVIPAFFSSLCDFDFIKNLIPEVLAETGITFCSVASVIQCVPEVFAYGYGIPIIRAAISIFPIGWLLPDFFEKASTTTTINSYLGLPVGASLFGDFYWNFGMAGIALALFFGVILAKEARKLQKRSTEVYFSIFYILLIGVRAGVFELVRPLFIVIFVPWFFKRIMKIR